MKDMRKLKRPISDTTKWLLSYFTYEVFRRPELLKRLQSEVDEVMCDADTCLDYDCALRLPVLKATLRELVRYYSAVPGPLPRYVPAGEGFIVDGKYVLPAGTEVALQSHTVHRNRDIFGDDADVFNPDRWLVSSEGLLGSIGQCADPVCTSTARCRIGRSHVQKCESCTSVVGLCWC